MKVIKINFCDFFKGFNKEDNDFINKLKKYFIVDISDNPQYIFYSVFGYEHLRYNCIRIFFTGECVVPDFNICDYAIGFDYITFEDRYLRMPLYALFQYKNSFLLASEPNKLAQINKRKFCSFVCSNDQGMLERVEMFKLLSNYKTVSSGGKFLNNIGGRVVDKHEFLLKHKFNIAFENCVANGYTTEKIIEAFAAHSIPIYYGNPLISLEFNSNAFINCHAFSSLLDVVKEVERLDQNDEAYQEMLNTPILTKPSDYEDKFEAFLKNIFEQDIDTAVRRPINTRINEIENIFRIYRRAEPIIKLIKLFRSLIRRIIHRAI